MSKTHGKYRTENRGRPPRGEISLKLMAFGYALLDCGGNATEAYRRTHPNCKADAAYLNWCAYKLKAKLIESDWFQQLLDEKGFTDERIADKLNQLFNAKVKVFFASEGKVVSEREVEDHKTQLAVVNLLLQAKKRLVQRLDTDLKISGEASLTGWVREHVQTESETGEQDESAGNDAGE